MKFEENRIVCLPVIKLFIHGLTEQEEAGKIADNDEVNSRRRVVFGDINFNLVVRGYHTNLRDVYAEEILGCKNGKKQNFSCLRCPVRCR